MSMILLLIQLAFLLLVHASGPFVPPNHYLSLLVSNSKDSQFESPLIIPVLGNILNFCENQVVLAADNSSSVTAGEFCFDLLSQVILASREEDKDDLIVDILVCLYRDIVVEESKYLVSYVELGERVAGVHHEHLRVKVRALCSWDNRSISSFASWMRHSDSLQSVRMLHAATEPNPNNYGRGRYRDENSGALAHLTPMEQYKSNPRLLEIPAAVFLSQIGANESLTTNENNLLGCSIYLQDNPVVVLAGCLERFSLLSAEHVDAVQTWAALQFLGEYKYFNSSSTESISNVHVLYGSEESGSTNATFFLGNPAEVRATIVSILDADTRQLVSEFLFKYLAETIGTIFSEGLSVQSKADVQIRVDVPEYIPLGIGSMLKAFVTVVSVHNNVKIGNLHDYILGNYSEILDPSLVSTTDAYEEGFNVIPTFSYRLLVLKAEEHFFPVDSVFFNRSEWTSCGVMSNVCIQTWYNPLYFIDQVYNCSAIPAPVVERLLLGFKRVQFLPDILAAVKNHTKLLVEPSLGVSVRSFTAPHEMGDNVTVHHRNIEYSIENYGLMYSARAYMVEIERVVKEHGIRSLIVAYDNPGLLEQQFAVFIDRLEKATSVQVLRFDNTVTLNERPLKKAAVEMLVLSQTTHLIGNRGSTFLDATYWFGECNPIVHFVNTAEHT